MELKGKRSKRNQLDVTVLIFKLNWVIESCVNFIITHTMSVFGVNNFFIIYKDREINAMYLMFLSPYPTSIKINL